MTNKVKIDLNRVMALLEEMAYINSLPLEDIEFGSWEGEGHTLRWEVMLPEIASVEHWKFIGLNNIYFIKHNFLEEPLE